MPLKRLLDRARRVRAGLNEARFARAVSTVGSGLTLDGAGWVENLGTLTIGRNFAMSSRIVPTRLKVGRDALLSIGDDVSVGFGTVVSAARRIVIGSGVRLGPYVSIVDDNIGDPDLSVARSGAEPIEIGDDADLGPRVTVLKGARIGMGATVTAGSVVAGIVPPGATATGIPARIVSQPKLPHDALYYAALSNPAKEAIVTDTRQVSYAELWRRIGCVGRALAAPEHGLKAGDRVLFLTGSKVDFLTVFYACLTRGLVAVPLTDGAARATVLDLAEACEARVLVAERALVDAFTPPLPKQLKVLDPVELLSVPAAPSSRFERDFVNERIAPNDTALLLFTSGTTAKKKAVRLTHHNLNEATRNINAFMRIDPSIREFVAIPLGHSFGLGRARAVFAVGGTLVLQDGPLNPAAMVKMIESQRCDALSVVPAGLALFQGPLEALLRRVGPRLKVLELGSAPMSATDKRRLLELFPNARVCMHYGLTEASRSAFMEFRAEQHKLDTVGRASPNVTLTLVNPDGTEAAPGEPGEIVVKGAHVTAGYWNNELLNARAFTEDGAFRTGDYGVLDADGYLRLLGRNDEMINSGGIKISPLELEAKIREVYPQLDCCVVGVPDPAGLAGEVPVVAYAGDGVPPLNDFLLALAQRVERPKLPYALVQVAKIPRTDNGKAIRKELRRLLVSVPRPQ
ncbi:MAG: AMP-binding protein [Archangiaceae bacterium]|nr:AMP-binding protein [Archangiaceae bacterium]